MTKGLRIGQGVTLPIDAVTETIAILAKRGAGKTYTASVLAEEMLAAELQVVIVDPMGAWWGLRTSADGKGPGFPIATLGGPRGDVPLEATGGVVVADLVVGEQVSVILDVSDFSKGERRRFVTDFLERLYQKNRDPMHVFLEEADLFAPQSGGSGRTDPENARMLGASYDLVRRGRGRGIGSTLITQRSASISKEVLEQAEILVALRTTGPRDRKAIEGWIDVHGEEEEQDKVMASLPGLPTGTAWVWWPVNGVLRQVKIRERKTFDSSSTPKVGQRQRRPKTVAEVDLGALQAQMKETIEKAKAEDPRELQRRIRELEKQIRAGSSASKAEVQEVEKIVEERVEVPLLEKGQVSELRKGAAEMVRGAKGLKHVVNELRTLNRSADVIAGAAESMERSAASIEQSLERAQVIITGGRSRRTKPPTRPRSVPSGTGQPASAPQRPRERPERASSRPRSEPPPVDGEFRPTKPQQELLDALAWFEGVQITELARSALAGFTGHKSKASSTFRNKVSALAQAGLIEYRSGAVALTDAGRVLAEPSSTPATPEALQAEVLANVGASRRGVLELLLEAYPEAVPREDLAAQTGHESHLSSTFRNKLSALKSMGFIAYEHGAVVALPVLFLEGAA